MSALRDVTQYNLEYSLQKFLGESTGIKTDLVYDGYRFPKEKPFITIEQMSNNYIDLVKQREVFNVIYRFQIGLRASNGVEKVKLQEELTDLFLFSQIPYYKTDQSASEEVGYFVCDLSNVVPIFNDDISSDSDYHVVYFDVEIESKIYRRNE